MKKEEIDYDKIYECKTGKFKIIEDLGCDEKYARRCRIKFINTGYEKEALLSNIKKGRVKDNSITIIGNKYKSNNYGVMEIIEDLGTNNGSHMCRIKFIDTGYEKIADYSLVKSGSVKDDSITVVSNKIYESNNSGPFRIIKDCGICNKLHKVIIEFLETGYTNEVILECAMKGNVKDPNNYKTPDIDYNHIYQSNNSGPFRIIKHIGIIDRVRYVEIEFINTGYRKTVRYLDAIKNEVKDKYFPSVYGIGYLGDAKIESEEDWILYHTWSNMIERCYYDNCKMYNRYGAIGITVSDEWKCLDTFMNDAKKIYNYQYKKLYPDKYHLDKDLLQQNINIENRIYSKDTCIWLYSRDNETLHSYIEPDKNYYGIIQCNNNYYVVVNINNQSIYLGVYDNIIVAANVYNNYLKLIGCNFLPLNNVQIVSYEEIINHSVNKKIMCNII